MQARDATGRQVSLLNDDIYASYPSYPSPTDYASGGDQSPLARTPELMRSDSYDSNASYDAISPLTPNLYDYTARPYYDDYLQEKQPSMKQISYVATHRAGSYEDDSSNTSQEKPGKRYPCRYRESHGCEKTFTTSGHASRHSKIHTAEKAVQCTFPGCHKKFTRADNMKQHLETHFKDKSRASGSSKTKASSISSPSKRGSVSSKSSSSAQSNRASRDIQMWDVEQYGADYMPVSSPGGTWDMQSLNTPLMSRPRAVRTSSGLDTLAAIACQEGA
ncbi:putative C2H2 transcription factor [Rosellinia necatrix]|uniref:C2H2 type master regulator of conidiophore development brlA n=1 Tax=Rosellinia necatrix TaxID=77044 RepID=A0A1W2TUU4_ROSNE|nr:putative C2H2 transcription factor [Rosellinia necatrix]